MRLKSTHKPESDGEAKEVDNGNNYNNNWIICILESGQMCDVLKAISSDINLFKYFIVICDQVDEKKIILSRLILKQQTLMIILKISYWYLFYYFYLPS